MEEKCPHREKLITILKEKYKSKFHKIIIAIHPYGTEGEIPGKCSNANFGMRSIYKYLQENHPNFDPKQYFVTNFDIDTRFHANFLNVAVKTIINTPNKQQTFFQPILYYNWGLDKLSFITRITGLIRNAVMMGYLFPFNVNVMSVYICSFELYIKADFTDPAYQMEDIIAFIRAMIKSKQNLQIQAIYLPTISGPTSGKNLVNEIFEWARQLRRWSVGSAEVFHFFVVKIKKIGVWKSLIWGIKYTNFYVGILCAQNLLTISTSLVVLLKIQGEQEINSLLFFIPLAIFYFCMLWIFILNSKALNCIATIVEKEEINIFRNFAHYLISIFSMIFIALVVLYGYIEVCFAGKKVCKHGAAKKEFLDKL